MYYMRRDVVTNLMHGQNTKAIKAMLHSSSETQGQIVGPKTKIKTGGKNSMSKSTKEKYEPLGTNSLRTSSKWPNEYSLLIGQFSAQSGVSIRSAVWNWCIKSLSPGARIFLSYFCSSNFFPARFDFRLRPHYLPLGLRVSVSVQYHSVAESKLHYATLEKNVAIMQ